MILFLTAFSFYSIFTQVPKTFNSTVVLQVGFLKHLEDVPTVLLDLFSNNSALASSPSLLLVSHLTPYLNAFCRIPQIFTPTFREGGNM